MAALAKHPLVPRTLEVPVFVALFFVADFALASAYLLNFMIGQPFGALTRFLDLNREATLPTWYASMQLAIVGTLLGLLAFRQLKPLRVRSWPLALLALLFLALSADEVAGIHELIGKKSDALLPGGTREGTAFKRTGIWVFIVGVPGTLVTIFLIWAARLDLRAAPAAAVKFLAGALILAIGALAVESTGNFLTAGSGALAVWVSLEELLEMIGVTVLLWGTVDLLRVYGLRLNFDHASTMPISDQRT